MVNDEVVVTYKRKRFSSQSHLFHGTKAPNSSPRSPSGVASRRLSPKVEIDTYDEKLNKNYSHCFRCGDFDVDENLLRCECCSKTYHLQCIDPPQKYIPQGKWRCSTCNRRNDFEESVQHRVRESTRARKNKRIEESEMGPMKLRSHKVLLSIKLAEGRSRKGSSSAADSSVNKTSDSIQMGYSYAKSGSRSKSTDLDDTRKPSPVCVNASSERKCSFECPEDSITMTLNSDKTDNRLSNDEYPKENCTTPLITFCRRVKKKQVRSEKFAERSSQLEEKQCSSPAWSSHAIEASCINGVPSQNCSFKEQSTGAAVLLEQAEMASVEKDAVDSAPAGGFGETKIAGNGCEELPSHRVQDLNIGNQHPVPSLPATDIPDSEDPPDKFMEAPANYLIENSILVRSKQSCSAKIATPVRWESGNKSAIADPGGTCLPFDVSEERDHLRELELSVALPASTCLSNVELSKPATDVVPENLLESQSSSTPSCPIMLADEETDGSGKELEWLENLDKALQEKKDRDTCSFIEKGGNNCGQVSSRRASPTIPTKSSVQSTCDQDGSTEYINQITPLQGKVSLTKLGDPGYEKQQHEETSNKSPVCTNFLGLSLPLNPEAPVDSFKDFQSMISPSSLGVKDYVHVHHRHFPWHASDETSSKLRHKQMIGNVGTMMLQERQGSLLDKFKRHSNEWSEEELDFLWIGVRRHGIDNWNAMLRDPKLRFLESRVAEDLAMRWNLEQRKLLNGTLIQPLRLSKSDHSSSPVMDDSLLARPTAADLYCGGSAWSHGCSEFPMVTADTKLSLGDVYLQKEKIPKRNLFHSLGVGVANPLTSESSCTSSFLSSFSICPVYLKAGIRHQKPIRTQNTRYDWEPSTSQQKSSERSIHEHQFGTLPASSNLPHWLREVLNTGPRPRESSLPPVVSTTAHSVSLPNNDLQVSASYPYNCEPPAPPKDSRGRGILKRKSVGCGNKIGGLRINEISYSGNEPWRAGVLPILGPTSQKPTLDITASEQNNISSLNKKSSDPVEPSDLVVIDSDASSEETISDDQNSRPS